MVYQAVLDARRAAEADQDSVREAVRLGLQLKRESEARKEAQAQKENQARAAR